MKPIFKTAYRWTLLSVLFFSIVFPICSPAVVEASGTQKANQPKTVSKNEIAINSLTNTNKIKLSTRSIKIVKGSSAIVSVLNLPSQCTISYSSSNRSVATVSQYGSISANRNGVATIFATIKQHNRTVRKLSCTVDVGPAAISIVIPKSKMNITLGKKGYIKYIIKPSNTAEIPKFTTSNRKVATVSKTGTISTHSVGTATIKAKISNGKYDSCKITVKKPPKAKKK